MTTNQLPLNYAGPDVSDVHVPSASKKISQRISEPKIKQKLEYTIEGVPIFKAGNWKNKQYSIQDLDEIVQNTNALIKSRLHEPPAKLGHSEDQQLLNQQGLPAAGYVSKVYRIGDELFADFVNVPKEIMSLLNERRYDKISSEIYLEFNHPTTQENIGKVLRAVAFLGADVPEVKGLGGILYHNDNNKNKYSVITFEDKNLQEVNSMSRKWDLKEIKRLMPCCFDTVQQYFEENKLQYIEGDKLAEILAEMKLSNIKNNSVKMRGEGSMECPDGYIWDDRTESCIPSGEKIKGDDGNAKTEQRKVCPKGYQWDETQNKCVPVMETIDGDNKKKDMKPTIPEDKQPADDKLDAANMPGQMPDGDKTPQEIKDSKKGKDMKPINPDGETDQLKKKKKMDGEGDGEMPTDGNPSDKPMGGIDEEGFGRSLIGAVMQAYGYEFDPQKPLHEQVGADDMNTILEDIKNWDGMKDRKPMIPEDKINEYASKMKESDWKGFPDDKRPPKGWWDKCVASVSGKTDTPDQLCGWVWAHGMGGAAKGKAESTRQSEQMSETLEVKELKQQIIKFENEKMHAYLDQLKKENRGIFLPKFDSYIETLYHNFSESNKLVKFGDSDRNVRDLFIEFLQEIKNSKVAIFNELFKTSDKIDKYGEGYNKQIEENILTEKYSELMPGRDLVNMDIAILAEQISRTEGINYKDALSKAGKILRGNTPKTEDK